MASLTEHRLLDPGLVLNGADGMSCLHACVQMVQRTCSGGEVYPFRKIDQILSRKSGTYSWEYAILDDLASAGFKIKIYQRFDIAKFVTGPEEYLLAYYGEEVGRDQIAHSDLEVVVRDARKFNQNSRVIGIKKAPGREDLCSSIDAGEYVVASINQRVLQCDPGVVAHLIFIFGYTHRGIRFHNPGPPATQSSEIAWDLFEKAWNKPTEEHREMWTFCASQ